MNFVRHARRLARRNPLGLPEEVVLGAALIGAIVGGAYLYRKYAAGSSTTGKSWVEITGSPQIDAGTVYRVTMAPITGATVDDGASGFDQFSDPAAGGGVVIIDTPFDSTWVDQDASRWHYQFLATTTATPTFDASTRIWAFQ